MMSELFDEEYLREQYNKSRDREMLAEGEARGEAIGKAQSIVHMISNIMSSSKCSLENALFMTGISMEDYQNSLNLLKS